MTDSENEAGIHPIEEDLVDEVGTFRDQIATVDKSGKRIWVYPKKPKGRFYNYRKYVSYFLLLVLFGLPWIKWNGKPFFLFNVLEGEFILFGVYFTPQDFHLFVIAMLILMIFIALFTVVFGRVFCGWVCPQTIFMEMVYRRIEYWIEGDATAQKRLNNGPWTSDKFIKKGVKQSLFFLIAIIISNTFLAYIIGIDEVLNIINSPIDEHWQGFSAMIIFSFVFYFVFARLREQVCTTICPYGRLQGVLLDRHSLAVQYDHLRGEPRGKLKKNLPLDMTTGDCIDCKLCVKVCPTGIDIRDGIQLECVNCTACMDACDEVMEKIDRPLGLIRIDSLAGIEDKEHKLINRRSVAYSFVLLVLIIAQSFLFIGRTQVEVLLLRTPGMLFQELEDGRISNLYNYQLINKTANEHAVTFQILNLENAEIEFIGKPPVTQAQKTTEGALFIKIPREHLSGRKNKLELGAYHEGELLATFTTNFLGPR